MKIVIDIPEEEYQNYLKMKPSYPKGVFCYIKAIKNGTPLPEHLSKIKDDIGKYELDCRFADVSQTDECTICNKNVFGSIYKIIDKYIEGSDEE